MATIFDTAKYILERKGPMSPMKLQRLCYYSQAWHLSWMKEALFSEDFQAWATGPVCAGLYHETRDKISVTADDITGDDGNLSKDQKDSIDRVLDYYGWHDAQWLMQLTILERPWKSARGETTESVNVITKESMATYYRGLRR